MNCIKRLSLARPKNTNLTDNQISLSSQTFPRISKKQGNLFKDKTRWVRIQHITHQAFNQKDPKEVFDYYIRTLDPHRTFFTQEDIDSLLLELNSDRIAFHRALRRRDFSFFQKVFFIFQERQQNRIAFVKKLRDTFNSNDSSELSQYVPAETIFSNRIHANWPTNEKEANDIYALLVSECELNFDMQLDLDQFLVNGDFSENFGLFMQSVFNSYDSFTNYYKNGTKPNVPTISAFIENKKYDDMQGREYDLKKISLFSDILELASSHYVRFVNDAGKKLLLAWVRLQFAHGAAKKFQEIIKRLHRIQRSNGSVGVDGIILDLSDNPGGVAIENTKIITYLLNRKNRPWIKKTFVYLNHNSASCSEELSMILKENGFLTVIEDNSFGKGIAMSPLFIDCMKHPIDILRGKNAPLVTTQYFYSERGFSPQGRGVEAHLTLFEAHTPRTAQLINSMPLRQKPPKNAFRPKEVIEQKNLDALQSSYENYFHSNARLMALRETNARLFGNEPITTNLSIRREQLKAEFVYHQRGKIIEDTVLLILCGYLELQTQGTCSLNSWKRREEV